LQAGFVNGLAASDPEGLRGYLRGLDKEAIGAPLGLALGILARQHGVDALLAWTEDLIGETPDAQLRAKIFRKAARTAARRDPHLAAEWIDAHWGRDYAADGPSAVAEAWILLAPLDAIDWLRLKAPAESHSKALGLAFGRWLYEDAAAAKNWLDATERTRFRDPAIAAYARNLARRVPEEAIGQCERVLESETREKCFISAARSWLKRDRAAAAAWLDDSPLDEESRDSLRTWAEKFVRRNPADKNATNLRRRARARNQGPAPSGSQ
jgi:hypothetical protein